MITRNYREAYWESKIKSESCLTDDEWSELQKYREQERTGYIRGELESYRYKEYRKKKYNEMMEQQREYRKEQQETKSKTEKSKTESYLTKFRGWINKLINKED